MKRISAAILALIMAFSCLATLTFAETAAPAWDGSMEVTWYLENADAKEFTITTAQELAGVAYMCAEGTTFAGQTIKLGADIDLSGSNWTPIGNNSKFFHGMIDGQGHTITGMTVSGDSNQQMAFIGVLSASENGFTVGVKNLNLTNINVTTTNTEKAAGLIGQMYVGSGTRTFLIQNVYVQGTINASRDGTVRPGGICSMIVNNGTGEVIFNNVVCDVDINANVEKTDKTTHVGGIIGNVNGNKGTVRVENSVNLGDLKGVTNVGGIVGFAGGSGTQIVQNCLNLGKIEGLVEKSTLGGIIAKLNTATYTVNNCINAGVLAPTDAASTSVDPICAGKATENDVATATNCYGVSEADGTYHKAITDAKLKGADALSNLDASFAANWRAFADGYVFPVCAAVVAGKIELASNRLCGIQETAAADGKISVRLLGALDSLAYKNAGFDVKIASGNKESKDVTVAYTSISYKSGEATAYVDASSYFTNYIYTIVLPEVSATGTVTIEVTPYTTALNGTKTLSATTYTVTYTDGVYVGCQTN